MCDMQLGYRFAHILRRMLPIAMYLLQRDSQFLNGHDLFLKRVGASYHAFIEEAEKVCRGKCQEDLMSTTRYVTWSLHTKSRSSLKAMLSKVSVQLVLHCSATLCCAWGNISGCIPDLEGFAVITHQCCSARLHSCLLGSPPHYVYYSDCFLCDPLINERDQFIR